MRRRQNVPGPNSESRLDQRNASQHPARNIVAKRQRINAEFYDRRRAFGKRMIGDSLRRHEGDIDRHAVRLRFNDDRILDRPQSRFREIGRQHERHMPPAAPREDAPEAAMISASEDNPSREAPPRYRKHSPTPKIADQKQAEPKRTPITRKTGQDTSARSIAHSRIWNRSARSRTLRNSPFPIPLSPFHPIGF